MNTFIFIFIFRYIKSADFVRLSAIFNIYYWVSRFRRIIVGYISVTINARVTVCISRITFLLWVKLCHQQFYFVFCFKVHNSQLLNNLTLFSVLKILLENVHTKKNCTHLHFLDTIQICTLSNWKHSWL